MAVNPNPTGAATGADALKREQDGLMGDVLRAGRTQGSDQTFENKVEASYKKIEDSIRQGNPGISQADLNAQIDERMTKMIDDEVKAKRVSQEIADAYKKALKGSEDADGFARLLTQERDKLASANPAAVGGMDAMNEKLMGMLLGLMERLLAGFDFGGKTGLSRQFAGVNGQPQKPVPQPGDPNFMGPMPEMVGPPAPAAQPVVAAAPAAPAGAVTSPVSPGGPAVTTDLSSAAPAAAASGAGKPPEIDSAAITAANDIDYATVTDGSRPAASFQASIQPSPAQQLLATPVASTAFTTIVPAANEPFAFDIGRSNPLTDTRFNVAATAPTYTVVDPRAPAPIAGVAELEAGAYAGKPPANSDRFSMSA